MVVSRILKGNIPVQNGIVHLIDKPLMVVARSLYDYVMQEGSEKSNRLYEFAQLIKDKGGAFAETLLESKVVEGMLSLLQCYSVTVLQCHTLLSSGRHPSGPNQRSVSEA